MIMGDLSNEPSMEEILASIRAIIADDRSPPPEPARRPGAPSEPRIVYSNDALLKPLFTEFVLRAMTLCEPDFAGEVNATVTAVAQELQRHGLTDPVP